jgi:hypothetical protein
VRITVLMTALAILTPGVATADVVRHNVIPEAYRGTWIAGAGGVILLSADAYVGPGEKCSVGWVSQTAGAQGSIYATYLRCADPENEAETKGLRTSSSGRRTAITSPSARSSPASRSSIAVIRDARRRPTTFVPTT